MRHKRTMYERRVVRRGPLGVIGEEGGVSTAPAEAGDAEGEMGRFGRAAEGVEECGDAGTGDGVAGGVDPGDKVAGGAEDGESVYVFQFFLVSDQLRFSTFFPPWKISNFLKHFIHRTVIFCTAPKYVSLGVVIRAIVSITSCCIQRPSMKSGM